MLRVTNNRPFHCLFYITVAVTVAEQDELLTSENDLWIVEHLVNRKRKEREISGNGSWQLREEIKQGHKKSRKHGPYMWQQHKESNISQCVRLGRWRHTHASPTHRTLFTTLTPPTHTYIYYFTVRLWKSSLHTHTHSHSATYLIHPWLSRHHLCSVSGYKTIGHPPLCIIVGLFYSVF